MSILRKFGFSERQEKEIINNLKHGDPLEVVLLDEKVLDVEVLTAVRYDEGNVILQRLDEGGLQYVIVPNADIC